MRLLLMPDGVESVVLEVLAPAPKNFPALDAAIARILDVDRAVDALNAKFATLGSKVPSSDGLKGLVATASQAGNTLDGLGSKGADAMQATSEAAAKAAASVRRLNAELAQQNAKTKELEEKRGAAKDSWEKARESAHKRLLKEEPKYAAATPAGQDSSSWLSTAEINQQSAARAAVIDAQKKLTASVRREKEIRSQIRSFSDTQVGSSGGSKQPGLTPASSPTATPIKHTGDKINLEIPGYDVLATLVGKVRLTLGPEQVEGGVTAVEKAQKADAKAKAVKAAGDIPDKTPPTPPTPPPAPGAPSGGESERLRHLKRTTGDGDGFDQLTSQVLDAKNPTVQVVTKKGTEGTEGYSEVKRTTENLAKVEDDDRKAIEQKFATLRKLRAGQEAEEARAAKAAEMVQRSQLKGATDLYRIRRESEIQTARAQDFKNIETSGFGEADKRALFSLVARDAMKARVDLHAEMAGKLTGAPQLAAQARLTSATGTLANHDAAINLNAAKAAEKAKADAAKAAADAAKKAAADAVKQNSDRIAAARATASLDVSNADRAALASGGLPHQVSDQMAASRTTAAASLSPLLAPAELAKMTGAEAAALQKHHGDLLRSAEQHRSKSAAQAKTHTDKAAKNRQKAEIEAAANTAKVLEATLKQRHAAALGAIPTDATRQVAAVAKAQASLALHQGMAKHHAAVLSGPVAASNHAVRHAAVVALGSATQNAAKATLALNAAQAQLTNSSSHVGKNFAQNLKHITQWAMGAGALYGTIGVFKSAIVQSIQMEYQMARLGQVFRGEGGAVRGLTNDVLRLAAANGRSSNEALESAIQWSRLGLNRLQVTEAVRVSLMASNVAEITAAEATEHLSSLMRVYDLNVRSLSGALGMLNATSNTFNVTNKDLLEGITRTSSAAKQAGLSLAELIGFIGAGVGSTGQTGTNIGNSMKSMIGAFSAPDKQEMMREKFSFEPTDANGDLKDMGDLLAQLYVHFQKLNEAQKQSFIFNIAGKNQASRVTALLDNYIKAQTLAIQALLGMNSAEKENEKIRATAKAQLQGLITEFERMSIAVGKFGTDKLNGLKLFSEVIMAMKNSLAVLSAGGGMAGALLVSVMAAIAAKSLYMMASMGSAAKGGSFLRASVVGLTDALRDVARAMISGLRPFGAWGAAASTTARSTHGAARAFKMLAVAVGVAMLELAAVVAIVAVVAYVFNRSMEHIGGSSDSANKAIDDFSESAERARGAAEAAALQVKLFDTTLKALANNPNQVERAGIIANVVEGLHPYTSDDMADVNKRRAKDALRDTARRELAEANALANANERNAAFERHFADAAVRASAERVKAKQRERQATEAAMEAAMEEGRRLKNSWRGGKMWFDWLSNKDDRKKNSDKIEELNTKRRKRYHEDSDEQEASRDAFRSRDERHLTYLQVQKRLVTDIQNLWSEMPGDSYDSRLDKEIGANAQILRTLESRLVIERALAETLNLPRAATLDVESDFNRRKSSALKQNITGRLSGEEESPFANLGFDPFAPDGLEKAKRFASSAIGDPDSPVNPGTAQLRARRKAVEESLPFLEEWYRLQTQINDAETESARIRSTPGAEANGARIRELEDSARTHRRTQAELENSRGVTRTREQIKIGADFGTMESGSFRTGYSDTDALVNQFNETGRASERHAMNAARMSAEADAASRFVGSGVASPSLPRARGRLSNQGAGLEDGERRAQNRLLSGGSPLDSELALQSNLARIERLRTGSVIERGMALSQGNDLLKIATELNQRQSDLEKAKVQAAKDYNKTLALSGPAEMLKRMALSKLTNNFTKVNGGQFLSFDEGSKKTIDDRMRPGWELNQNRNAMNKLGLGGDDAAARALAFEKFKSGMESWMSVVRQSLGTAVQPQIDASAAAAASIGSLGRAADAAAAALLRLAGAPGAGPQSYDEAIGAAIPGQMQPQ